MFPGESRCFWGFPVFDGIWRFGRNDEHCVPDPGRSMGRDGNGSLLLECTFALILIISLVGLIRIASGLGEGKVFSRTLTVCVWLIGAVITAASVGIPRLPDYQSSGFEILSHGNFVLIDGTILVPGILLVILGSLIQEGFKLQKDEEEIL